MVALGIDIILIFIGLFFIATAIKGVMNKSLEAEDVNLGGRIITFSAFAVVSLTCFYFSDLVPLREVIMVLFGLFILGSIAGLVKPGVVLRWEADPDRLQLMHYVSVGTLIFIVLLLLL